jgi:hypothetical protein
MEKMRMSRRSNILPARRLGSVVWRSTLLAAQMLYNAAGRRRMPLDAAVLRVAHSNVW